MALSPTLSVEVRPTGNVANGGAFRAGATGTDYSQQDAPQVTYTDLVIGGTTTQLTSAANPFTAAHVGNVINITGGTGFTVGRYEIMSVATSTATMDRSVGTGASTGGAGRLGGAVDHPATAAAFAVASNKVFVKAGTYTTTATITFAQNPGNPASAIPAFRLIGYNTTRTDKGAGGRPTIQLLTNVGLIGIRCTGTGAWVENFIVDCNNLGTSTGIQISFSSNIHNCKVMNFTLIGIQATSGYQVIRFNEVTLGTAAATAAITTPANPAQVVDNWVHDNACPGISTAGVNAVVAFNVISNNSGASSDGIVLASQGFVFANTIYKSGRHGINFNSDALWALFCAGNILSENGGFGIVGATAPGGPADPIWDGNAFYLNASGARSNMDDTSVNPQNNVAAYARTLDIALTADPFTAKASNDYSLNNAAGGGAAIRGHSAFQSWPGLSVVSYADMGAIRHQDPAGGGQVNIFQTPFIRGLGW
jgi:hypothetical protein